MRPAETRPVAGPRRAVPGQARRATALGRRKYPDLGDGLAFRKAFTDQCELVHQAALDLGEPELAGSLASFARPGVVLIDDAELLRDCGAAAELSRLVALGGDAGRALVLGGDAEGIGVGFSGWQVEAKRARRGCLTAPSTIPEGDLIGVRLSRDVLGQPPRPGRCLLHTGDGKLVTVTVPPA